MSKPTLYTIGGCAYRMQIDARLAASITGTAVLTTLLSGADEGAPSLVLNGVSFTHTSNLPQGRCLWIRGLLEDSDAPDLAVSVDSDGWYEAEQLARELLRISSALRQGIADDVGIWTAPVIQANGLINWRCERNPGVHVNPTKGELADIMAGRKPITSTGFGLVILNLAWWRAHWPDPEPNITSINTGEDIELSRGVTSRGGRIEPLPVNVAHGHFVW